MEASPVLRLSEGQLAKQYSTDIPEWAQFLLPVDR